MELALDTHSKPAPNKMSEDVGLTKFVVNEKVFKMLEEMEQKLIESDQDELFLALDPNTIELNMPCDWEDLTSCSIRMYIDKMDENTSLFHIVGHDVEDNSLIYTDAVKLRTITA